MAIKQNNSGILTKSDKPTWYIVQAYSGFERIVIEMIKSTSILEGAEDDFCDFYCAMEEINTNTNPNKKPRSIYPGYIFVKMKMNDKSWSIVSGVSRVIGFVGADKFAPRPLTDEEYVEMIENIAASVETKTDISFAYGDDVKINDGSFQSLTGVVNAVDNEKKKVSVTVRIFDREAAIDLDWSQVDKI